jgi:hypothetical protein
MGLREAKREREAARAAEEERGRRVVVEIPLSDVEVVFLVEDGESFAWGKEAVAKPDIAGARLLVNGGVLKECGRPGVALPPPGPPEGFEGRERWEVVVYRREGDPARIPCGSLREGVSREIAGKAFAAVRATVEEDS